MSPCLRVVFGAPASDLLGGRATAEQAHPAQRPAKNDGTAGTAGADRADHAITCLFGIKQLHGQNLQPEQISKFTKLVLLKEMLNPSHLEAISFRIAVDLCRKFTNSAS